MLLPWKKEKKKRKRILPCVSPFRSFLVLLLFCFSPFRVCAFNVKKGNFMLKLIAFLFKNSSVFCGSKRGYISFAEEIKLSLGLSPQFFFRFAMSVLFVLLFVSFSLRPCTYIIQVIKKKRRMEIKSSQVLYCAFLPLSCRHRSGPINCLCREKKGVADRFVA